MIALDYNGLRKENNILPLLYGLVTLSQGREGFRWTVIVAIPRQFFSQSVDGPGPKNIPVRFE